MKQFSILFWDDYFDIPLRGIAQSGAKVFAFKAVLLEESAEENAANAGMNVQLKVFECDANLCQMFEEQKKIFRAWRSRFDAKQAETASHPLYTNPTYKELCAKIDAAFAAMRSPVFEQSGLMGNDSVGNYAFRSIQ